MAGTSAGDESAIFLGRRGVAMLMIHFGGVQAPKMAALCDSLLPLFARRVWGYADSIASSMLVHR